MCVQPPFAPRAWRGAGRAEGGESAFTGARITAVPAAAQCTDRAHAPVRRREGTMSQPVALAPKPVRDGAGLAPVWLESGLMIAGLHFKKEVR